MRSLLAAAKELKNLVLTDDVVPVDQYIENELCTFLGTLKGACSQRLIWCRTCNLDVCPSCANVCHENCLVEVSKIKKGFCGCGARGGAHCRALVLKISNDGQQELKDKTLEELRYKWNRPISQVTVGQDLPRLGSKHELRDEAGNIIFPSQGSTLDKPFVVIRDMFHCLSQQFSCMDIFNEFFDPCFVNFRGEDSPESYDLAGSINDYCDTKLGELHPVTKLLKASVCQGIVSPVWLYFKTVLLKDFPFKDTKNGWAIYVFFTQENVTVIHKKTEQGHSGQNQTEPPFLFTWELKMKFDRHMKDLLSFDFALTDWIDAEDSNLVDVSARLVVRKPLMKRTFVPPPDCLIGDYEKEDQLDKDSVWEKLHTVIHSCDVAPVYWRGEQSVLSPQPLSKEQIDHWDALAASIKTVPIVSPRALPNPQSKPATPSHSPVTHSPATHSPATHSPATYSPAAQSPASVPLATKKPMIRANTVSTSTPPKGSPTPHLSSPRTHGPRAAHVVLDPSQPLATSPKPLVRTISADAPKPLLRASHTDQPRPTGEFSRTSQIKGTFTLSIPAPLSQAPSQGSPQGTNTPSTGVQASSPQSSSPIGPPPGSPETEATPAITISGETVVIIPPGGQVSEWIQDSFPAPDSSPSQPRIAGANANATQPNESPSPPNPVLTSSGPISAVKPPNSETPPLTPTARASGVKPLPPPKPARNLRTSNSSNTINST